MDSKPAIEVPWYEQNLTENDKTVAITIILLYIDNRREPNKFIRKLSNYHFNYLIERLK